MNFINSKTYLTEIKIDEKIHWNLPVNLDNCESYCAMIHGANTEKPLYFIRFEMVSGKNIDWYYETKEERIRVFDAIEDYIAKFNKRPII